MNPFCKLPRSVCNGVFHNLQRVAGDITWPSETGEDSDNIFYAAWGPEKDLKSAKDGDELQKVKKSLFGTYG